MDPRFLDIEVQDKFINKEPSRFTQRRTDTYTFLIDMTKDEIRYDFETLDYISENIANDGNAQYLFKVDSVMCEDPIKNFRREYNIYDSDIWLFPKGRKRRTMEETLPNIINVAKRNRWNVSPRMDLMTDTDEEESD
jgi:organic radical activating enzyme